jgi:hypothetical protein
VQNGQFAGGHFEYHPATVRIADAAEGATDKRDAVEVAFGIQQHIRDGVASVRAAKAAQNGGRSGRIQLEHDSASRPVGCARARGVSA